MKIVISGSTGMVGSALVEHFKAQGHDVWRLVRGETELKNPSQVIRWDVESQMIEADKLEASDVIIHLGGANIAHKNWDEAYKKVIHDSRVLSTQLLSQTIAQLKLKPKVFICASAIGYYKDSDNAEDVLDENAVMGQGFLAEVCRKWEEAAQAAQEADVRTINLRIGVVLGLSGGVIHKVKPIFSKGLGGNLGNGKQLMSWIALEEISAIIDHCIASEDLKGPVNCVSPEVATNASFTKSLADILQKPAFFHAPAFVIKLMLGEMGKALLLSSQYVKPAKLLATGYKFQYAELKSTLQHILK